MTEDRVALLELIEKAGDTDFLRDLLAFVVNQLMEFEVEQRCGAGRHERKTGPDAVGEWFDMYDRVGADHIVIKARDLETTFGLKIRNEDVRKNLRVAVGLNFLVGVYDF